MRILRTELEPCWNNGWNMPNPNYQRGRRLEWEVKKDLESEGFIVMRASGSHGIFDLIALKEFEDLTCHVRLIQCKVTKNKKTIPKLLKDFTESLPFSQENFSQHLVVKITGEGGYTYYTPER